MKSASLENKIVQQDLQFIYDHFPERSQLKGSTFLVTGCAGFIGFYLMHFLVKYADELGIRAVIGCDNFKRGKPEWLEELHAAYKVLRIETLDIAKVHLNSITDLDKVTHVVHMASIASPIFYRQFPLETVDANVWGLRALLDYFRGKDDIQGFLFFSSSEIYGDPEPSAIPTSEDYPGRVMAIGPRACYDESKRFGEMLCYLYANVHQMPIRVVRPFNNFGPGLDINDKRVPADFASAVLNNKDIVMHSDGQPTRTFCYIADAIVGYLKTLTYSSFDAFNIGIDSPEISIRRLAEIYVQKATMLTGYVGKACFKPSADQDYLTHNPNRRCPNIDKARKLLKYQPSIIVDDGVERYLKFLLANRSHS